MIRTSTDSDTATAVATRPLSTLTRIFLMAGCVSLEEMGVIAGYEKHGDAAKTTRNVVGAMVVEGETQNHHQRLIVARIVAWDHAAKQSKALGDRKVNLVLRAKLGFVILADVFTEMAKVDKVFEVLALLAPDMQSIATGADPVDAAVMAVCHQKISDAWREIAKCLEIEIPDDIDGGNVIAS